VIERQNKSMVMATAIASMVITLLDIFLRVSRTLIEVLFLLSPMTAGDAVVIVVVTGVVVVVVVVVELP